ncbi:fatty acyl-AMP ligase [Stigmatella hybrida]|uniref:fatty acyl-AMP ligase n=1 Tax=Stigmatella hybrida TaxID=394097 RepID=UPI001CDAF57D|nr:fatty acyl-AMP ligase [Stigmatella hybrida]
MNTIVEAMRQSAERDPRRPQFTWLMDGEQEGGTLDTAGLDRLARAGAAALQEAGATGERVVLLIRPGLEFIAGFLACLYAGALPVPAVVPRRAAEFERLFGISSRVTARFALADGDLIKTLPEPLRQASGMSWLAIEQVLAADAELWRPFSPKPSDLAFLQFTSGSTGNPRGVMVSHGNLVHNSESIVWVRREDPCRVVGWLPPYHDMGLIGCIIHPILSKVPSVLMSPHHFLQRPARWLEAVTRYRGTISPAPDFALRLCADRISDEDRDKLDLSSWNILICGAEPVRPSTWQAFAPRFVPVGLDPNILSPCYGLAESTLITTGRRTDAPLVFRSVDASALEEGRVEPGGERTRMLFACGRPVPGQQVVIVDEQLRPVPDAMVGEILIAGPSATHGYYGDEQATQETFKAEVQGHEGTFIRTGDLGFMDDGSLYIVGRIKDIVKIRGKTLHAQDIEDAASAAHAALSAGALAAFSVEEEGEERLVIVAELKRTSRNSPPEPIVNAVCAAVTRAHGVVPFEVCLLRPGGVPRTSSGKVRRRESRRQWMERRLNPFAAEEELSQAAP